MLLSVQYQCVQRGGEINSTQGNWVRLHRAGDGLTNSVGRGTNITKASTRNGEQFHKPSRVIYLRNHGLGKKKGQEGSFSIHETFTRVSIVPGRKPAYNMNPLLGSSAVNYRFKKKHHPSHMNLILPSGYPVVLDTKSLELCCWIWASLATHGYFKF